MVKVLSPLMPFWLVVSSSVVVWVCSVQPPPRPKVSSVVNVTLALP